MGACLLNPNRNPHLAKGDIELRLREHLGAGQITWLDDGTDGHVDDIARFVAADMIVVMVEPDESDPNHQPLHENRKRLEQVFDVAELPMPCRIESDGQRLPASYANFLSVTRTSSIRRTATPTTSGR